VQLPTDPHIGETRIDFSRWPAVVMTTPEEVVTEDLQRFFEWWEREVEVLREPFILVNDTRKTKEISALQRRLIASWMDPARDTPLVGTALVFRSALMRGFLTAMMWLNRPAYPVKVFGDLEEAIAWAQVTVEAHGPLPTTKSA
jgi:hypothetical protein